MKHLWIQYTYDDPDNASVIQTADSEEEAREEDEIVTIGAPWYRYDIIPKPDTDGTLANPDGPHYFNINHIKP